jgi:spore coat polysaccharide biosynthesis protein SpsF
VIKIKDNLMYRYAIFIQARMSSNRLPGKILSDIEGSPMLLRQLQRLRNGAPKLPIVVITSTDVSDDPIEAICLKYEFDCYRGSLDDVISRVVEAAKHHGITHIIRVGGDDPLIDPNACKYIHKIHVEQKGDFLYASNRGGWPYGCACELMSVDALSEIRKKTNDKLYLEHIDQWFLDHPNDYIIIKVSAPDKICRPKYYFSVDYPEDIQLIRSIFRELKSKGDYFSLEDVIDLCDKCPEILNVNKHLHKGFDS